MKSKIIYAAFMAILMATLPASAASVTAREVNSTSKFKLESKYKDASWASSAYDQTREVEVTTTLSAAELGVGALVEVAYVDPAQKTVTRYADLKSAKIDKASYRGLHSFTWEAAPARKDAWAVRVIVGGKAVAWAAENDKALAWIKALPVEAKP